MKHKIRVKVGTEKRGFLGIRRKQTEERDVWVDGKTYREIQRRRQNRQISIEEIAFYDAIYGDG